MNPTLEPVEMTFTKQIKHLFSLLLLIAISIYFVLQTEGVVLYYFLAVIFVFGFFTLYLHLQYYRLDKNTKVQLNLLDRQLVYENNTTFKTIDFSKIITIEKHISYSASASRGRLPTDAYSYIVIKLSDNSDIIVSSLVDDKLEDLMELQSITIIKKRIIATIK